MRAIVVDRATGPPDLRWEEVPDPVPARGQVLLKVHATAVNRADLLQARGLYDPPPGASPILGLEAAGVIEHAGAEVTAFQPGDKVFALLPGGGYAEKVAVDAGMLMRIPASLNFFEAAAIPEAWFTAFLNLVLESRLTGGETVLIHAGASGVGTAAIQLVRDSGGTAIVTVGTDDKAAFCKNLGAREAVNYRREIFSDVVLKHGGADIVLDCVGKDYLAGNIACLRAHGRLTVIGLMSGKAAELDLALLVSKQLRIRGSLLRPRSLQEKQEITARFTDAVLPKLAAKRLHPVIDSIVPIQKAAQAHQRVADNKNLGKIVLEVC